MATHSHLDPETGLPRKVRVFNQETGEYELQEMKPITNIGTRRAIGTRKPEDAEAIAKKVDKDGKVLFGKLGPGMEAMTHQGIGAEQEWQAVRIDGPDGAYDEGGLLTTADGGKYSRGYTWEEIMRMGQAVGLAGYESGKAPDAQVRYDENWGWLVPAAYLGQIENKYEEFNHESWLSVAGPWLSALTMVVGGPMASSVSAAGGIGATLSAAPGVDAATMAAQAGSQIGAAAAPVVSETTQAVGSTTSNAGGLIDSGLQAATPSPNSFLDIAGNQVAPGQSAMAQTIAPQFPGAQSAIVPGATPYAVAPVSPVDQIMNGFVGGATTGSTAAAAIAEPPPTVQAPQAPAPAPAATPPIEDFSLVQPGSNQGIGGVGTAGQGLQVPATADTSLLSPSVTGGATGITPSVGLPAGGTASGLGLASTGAPTSALLTPDLVQAAGGDLPGLSPQQAAQAATVTGISAPPPAPSLIDQAMQSPVTRAASNVLGTARDFMRDNPLATSLASGMVLNGMLSPADRERLGPEAQPQEQPLAPGQQDLLSGNFSGLHLGVRPNEGAILRDSQGRPVFRNGLGGGLIFNNMP